MAPPWPVSNSALPLCRFRFLGLTILRPPRSPPDTTPTHARSKAGKSIYFFPLRDAYGTVQLVVSDGVSDETLALMRDTPGESTVLIEGVVIERPPNQKRPVRTFSHISTHSGPHTPQHTSTLLMILVN